ncbi:hypothetical protein MUP01_13320 [Candidatus Bathyarchaeota archaeon]|nr:hypothetical protein [Candidatus Bathyarchaeota archaeon]
MASEFCSHYDAPPTSASVVDESFARRLQLNRAILKNKYWFLPVDNVGHENYVPVGRGARTSDFCGRWVTYKVCKNVEGHKGVSVGDLDCTGKVVVRHKHLWCHKSSCPVCFNRGWSVREAHAIVGRIVEGEKRGLGLAEHITVSPKVTDHGLPESVLRVKCRKALLDRGVEGGCMIFHGFRENKERGCLEWSPHYHVLGFVVGREKCRKCKMTCFRGCGGFVDRNYRCGEEDGYLVKVHGKRKTVFGTAWYQLNHATIRLGVRRFHVVTWFGSASYCKFKGQKPVSEDTCPACGGEMVRSVYVGKRHIAKEVGDPDYVAWFVDDELDSLGEPNYIDVVGGRIE